jgi:peptidoglycan/LPS O-acetylase OafA/YrhL
MNTGLKFQSLEATRGLAAIIVVIHHSHFLYGTPSLFIFNGALFVDYFFILSGFIMSNAYQDKIGRTINFKSYFLLRFGRLFPLHIFTLLIWVPFILIKLFAYNSGVGGSDPTSTCNLSSFISNIFMVHSLGIYNYESWNFPSWSISVEFYTYIIFFVYALAVRNKKYIFYPLAISLMSYIYLCYLFPHGEITRTYDYGLIRCAAGFFAGVALFSFYNRRKLVFSNEIRNSILELISISLMIFFVSNAYKSITYVMLSFITFAIIIYLFSSEEIGIVSKVLKLKPLQLIGKFSYSIYMVHALIVVGIQNTFERIFGFESSDIMLTKGEHLNVIITKWAFLLDSLEVLIVIVISYYTYNYIELPWRNKFREIAVNKN